MTNMERNGRMTQMHAIVSFDVDTLPQANHGYVGAPAVKTGVPRATVPVRDGRSQGVSNLYHIV